MPEQPINEAMVAQVMKQVMGQANGLMNNSIQTNVAPQQGSFMPAPVQQQQTGLPNPQGWSVPIETDLGGVTVTVYVQFPAHTFPQFQQIIATMMNMGYNVRSFSKSNGYGSNSGSWGGRSGGSWGSRGGYGRGGYGRGY